MPEGEPWDGAPTLGCAGHCGGGEVHAEDFEPRRRPCRGVVADAAARDQDAAASRGCLCGQEIHEPGRRLAMVPRRVSRHVMRLPIPRLMIHERTV